jgi:predicted ATPase
MYLRSIRVQNIKMMRDVELSFMRGDKVRPWTVIIGENGLCKTALLQSIALAASGPDRANQLVDVGSLPRRKRREEPSEAVISAVFELGSVTHPLREYPGLSTKPEAPPVIESTLEIPQRWRVFKGKSRYTNIEAGDDPLRTVRAEALPFWFVAGYGPIRMFPKLTNGESNTDTSVENLFNSGSLLSREQSNIPVGSLVEHYSKTLSLSLSFMLPKLGGIAYGIQGSKPGESLIASLTPLEFDTSEGAVGLPVEWLSQGYQTTIAWISDLITRLFHEAKTKEKTSPGWPFPTMEEISWNEHLEGLVLIDEIDLHLHPKWQAEIVTRLKELFPRLQFIVTTHSPMVLPGCEQDEILIARQNGVGEVIFEQATEAPALMTGSEIYKTFFGLDKLYPNKLGEDLQRYGYLTSNPYRTDQEEAEMHQLQERLKAANVDPGWEAAPREIEA